MSLTAASQDRNSHQQKGLKQMCDFCDEIYDEFKLNTTHPMNREGFYNCITYDKINNNFCLWHECVDDYYTGNIMEIKYCPVCGRKLSDV